ncbi:MAG TPA: phasin family protein [Methylocystis sp.]|nr:phasin family protein [Methylocystis sp.]
MAQRKPSRSKTEENVAPQENDILPGEEAEASAAGESSREPAAAPVAASVEASIETAAQAVPEQVVQVIEVATEANAAEDKLQPRPRAIEAAAVVALDFAAPVKTASEWRKTTAEAWNEGATALIDLASALTKARTVSEVLALQARFARERIEGFAKLSSNYAELTQRAAKDAGVAAFRFSKSA